MINRSQRISKDIVNRKRRNIILIGCEGNNKTEKLYFNHFNRVQKDYVFRFVKGNDTDPLQIIDHTIESFDKEELDLDKGDLAFAVFDMDLDDRKQRKINKVLRKAMENHVRIIRSNPCFEVWYLMHFVYSTRQFPNGNEVITALKKYVPEYRKNSCDFDLYHSRTKTAIENCKKLEKYHETVHPEINNKLSNPMSDVYQVVEKVYKA